MAQACATALFVGSSLAYATQPRPAPLLPALGDPALLPVPVSDPAAPDHALVLPQLYLSPENPLMWALLVVLWALLSLDAAEQLFHSSEDFRLRSAVSSRAVWPVLTLALLAGAVWPWMVGRNLLAVVPGALFMVLATVVAAVRAQGSHRPAIGFLAGWTTAIAVAAIAALLAYRLSLSMTQTAVLAILPGVLAGIAGQDRIGQSVAYPAALIWAFCAMALTTMGSSPVVALAAIAGISAMALMLIRAAS